MKKGGIVLAIIGMLFIVTPSASAITPVPPLKTSICYPIIVGEVVESYAKWVIRLDAATGGDTCYTFRSSRIRSYKEFLGISKTKIKVEKLNEFDKRIQACKVGNTTFLLGDLKCLFRVSFFPTTEPLKNSMNNISKSFNNNQPLSYIPVAFKTVTSSFDSMGGRYCANNGGNSLDYSVTLPATQTIMDFKLPCQPPGALRVFRQYLVTFLFLGFALWLYAVAIKWWDKRER